MAPGADLHEEAVIHSGQVYVCLCSENGHLQCMVAACQARRRAPFVPYYPEAMLMDHSRVVAPLKLLLCGSSFLCYA